MPDDAQVDPRQTIEALRRELAARTAERDEALAQQAAVSEILHIINGTGSDLEPVFQTIVEKAHKLCRAVCGRAAQRIKRNIRMFDDNDDELLKAIAKDAVDATTYPFDVVLG